MIETDKAYLAGLIDGEGCISISSYLAKRTPTRIYYLQLIIAYCDKDILTYWCNKTGLGVIKTYKAQRANCRDGYQWRMSSIQAEALLKEVYPYLMLKKEQADIAFRFQSTMNQSWGGKGRNCIKGGKRVNPEIMHQRERYKQALTRIKGYLTKRGRPAGAI
jgi:hypothetical protein